MKKIFIAYIVQQIVLLYFCISVIKYVYHHNSLWTQFQAIYWLLLLYRRVSGGYIWTPFENQEVRNENLVWLNYDYSQTSFSDHLY